MLVTADKYFWQVNQWWDWTCLQLSGPYKRPWLQSRRWLLIGEQPIRVWAGIQSRNEIPV